MKLFTQLKNAFLEKIAGTPTFTASDEGRIVYDTTAKRIKVNDGTSYADPGLATTSPYTDNFVGNSDFESGITGWTGTNCTLSQETTSPINGSASLRATGTANTYTFESDSFAIPTSEGDKPLIWRVTVQVFQDINNLEVRLKANGVTIKTDSYTNIYGVSGREYYYDLGGDDFIPNDHTGPFSIEIYVTDGTSSAIVIDDVYVGHPFLRDGISTKYPTIYKREMYMGTLSFGGLANLNRNYAQVQINNLLFPKEYPGFSSGTAGTSTATAGYVTLQPGRYLVTLQFYWYRNTSYTVNSFAIGLYRAVGNSITELHTVDSDGAGANTFERGSVTFPLVVYDKDERLMFWMFPNTSAGTGVDCATGSSTYFYIERFGESQ